MPDRELTMLIRMLRCAYYYAYYDCYQACEYDIKHHVFDNPMYCVITGIKTQAVFLVYLSDQLSIRQGYLHLILWIPFVRYQLFFLGN